MFVTTCKVEEDVVERSVFGMCVLISFDPLVTRNCTKEGDVV